LPAVKKLPGFIHAMHVLRPWIRARCLPGLGIPVIVAITSAWLLRKLLKPFIATGPSALEYLC